MRVSACTLVVAAFTAATLLSAPPAAAQLPYWHERNFRYLPQTTFDLVAWVTNLPRYETFVAMSAQRQERFAEFMDALLSALADTLRDGSAGDWCGVRAAAIAAGYDVNRVFEKGKKRWMIYAFDTQATGQPYLIISPNPNPQRDVVLQAPHNTFDRGSGRLAAQLFLDVNGRALLLNKAHRCSGSALSGCSGTTTACGGVFKAADSAHASTSNAFQIVHAVLNDRWSNSKFVQVHSFGNATSEPDYTEISDGTANDIYDGELAWANVSSRFADRLKRYVPASTHGGIWACEAIVGTPPNDMCATDNTQGRYSNGNDPNTITTAAEACSLSQYNYTGRFLHLETGREFRDDSNADGMYWRDLSEALKDIWACTLNTPAVRNCAMTTQAASYSTLACPAQ
jgi:hypothetical protein